MSENLKPLASFEEELLDLLIGVDDVRDVWKEVRGLLFDMWDEAQKWEASDE